jgi:hypothetical protein
MLARSPMPRRPQPERGFLDRLRLAGQHGFLDPQVLAVDQPQIGGHLVARLQQHPVAGHQCLGRDFPALAVAQHHGTQRQHLADGGQRRFGLAFLHEADDGVDEDHAQNHAGIDAMTQRGGDGGRTSST